ncbi:hypothetical protein AL755_09550 [Arthrobacter sp. ERGS1:01]|uniref:AfsA-related hotdog domain-containing protein n=1 Tax=Arthrobacter sp. ERGS1:01 TaxID=1704044 RepID=UPI0006B51B88|nr:AfsA-related hotdog domain-containing protein [Arthrobacter sp. ERGS1:01]ALE05669.1 hypothetical protein AL755_09550 [Arthrobacter sp. ERGS1:01]
MRQSIEGSLVHKSSPNQVLLLSADASQDGTLRLIVGLSPQHPSAGSLPSASTLVGVELMRQCAIAFAHLSGGVPRGWAFIMNQLSFAWLEGAMPTASEQFAGHVDVRLRAVKMRRDQVSDLQLEADFMAGGVILGSGCGDLSCLPPRAYQAIRRNAPTEAIASTGPLGAVLADIRRSDGELEAQLVWNRGDTFIFDHPSDHVSGMLLASALLQSHHLLAGSQAGDFSMQCHNFGEFNAPVTVSAVAHGAGRTVVTMTQSGRIIASGQCGKPVGAPDAGPAVERFHRVLTPAG